MSSSAKPTLLDEGARQGVPGIDGVAQHVRPDRFVGEAPATQVVERRLTVVTLGQHAVVERDRGIEHLAQPLAARVLATRPFAELNPRPGCEPSQRLGEVDRVALHDKVEEVTAAAAAKALPRLARRSDGERRRLLAVEGAQALVGRTRLAQLDTLADQVDEVDLLLDLCGSAD